MILIFQQFVSLEGTLSENRIKQISNESLSILMLNLIHNIRFDRIRRNYDHSFRKNLNNYNTAELSGYDNVESLDHQLLSSNWLTIYRKP